MIDIKQTKDLTLIHIPKLQMRDGSVKSMTFGVSEKKIAFKFSETKLTKRLASDQRKMGYNSKYYPALKTTVAEIDAPKDKLLDLVKEECRKMGVSKEWLQKIKS